MRQALAILKLVLKFVAILAAVLVFIVSAAWGVLALYYSDLDSGTLRSWLAGSFALISLVMLSGLALRRWRWRAVSAYVLVFAGLLAWWSGIEPSNNRAWQPEVAIMPAVTIDGDQVTVRNIRNFIYRTETDFTPAYYDKTFDLAKLDSVDLIASYWAGPAIAHIFVTFNFGPDEHLSISIERRDEVGETYSTVKGLFKQFELFYVVADERDVVRLRTNVRQAEPEEVYIYRLKAPVEFSRRLFLEYVHKIDDLATHPEFYNTLTTNCTGNIWLHSKVNPGSVPYSWKILLSGYVPEYLYELGRLDASLPFPELRERSHVNAAALAFDQAGNFSTAIRAGLPGMATAASAAAAPIAR